VEPRVVDRDACVKGEGLDEPLILVRELLPAALVGEAPSR
jgi:hypothetical protein